MNKEHWTKAKERAQAIGHSLLHWTWTQGLLYWIILSAGTMSELAFLLASMWMSENSAAHKFVLQFMTEDWTTRLSWWATGAYVGLPVAILPLAILTVITHARVWIHEKRFCAPAIWTLLYGLPTLVFLTLDVITVACSVLSVSFELPDYLVVARALSAYSFALIALLYTQIGKKQEADRLKEKDNLISELRSQIESLTSRIETINANTKQREQTLIAEISQLKTALAERKNENEQLQNEANKLNGMALQGYGEECQKWLNSGIKTAFVEEIMQFTGHSKRKILNAKLTVSPRNPEKILISALREWLAITPPPERTLHVV